MYLCDWLAEVEYVTNGIVDCDMEMVCFDFVRLYIFIWTEYQLPVIVPATCRIVSIHFHFSKMDS